MSEIKWRKFEFSIVDDYDGELVEEGVVVLHPDVIAAVDDSFREHLYDLNKPEEIAEHIIRFTLRQAEPELTTEEPCQTATLRWSIYESP